MSLNVGTKSLGNYLNRVRDTAIGGFDNAARMYRAGNADKYNVAPSFVIDSEFLTKDRYRDRLMAWSDMTADPMFAMYPAEQVFNATNLVMNMHPEMESPGKREALR